jgi:hypothetical protein
MSTGFVNPVFDLFEKQVVDDSIAQYEYVRYATVNGLDITQFSGPTYKIVTKDLDSYLLPQKGYLDLVFRIGTSAGVLTDNTTQLHQNVLALFQKASYYINSVAVDEVELPALTTTIRNLLAYSQDYLDKQGPAQWFYSDAAGNLAAATGVSVNGAFNAASDRCLRLQVTGSNLAKRVRVLIPLERIFGFLSDYSPCMRGLEHRFEFIKQSKIKHAILCDADASAANLTIIFDEMSVWLPKLLPSPAAEQYFLSQIKSNSSTMISYDSWNGYRAQQPAGSPQLNWQIDSTSKRPKYVFISFQVARRLNTAGPNDNPGVMDNLLVQEIELRVNSKRFPLEQYRLDFTAANAGKSDSYARAFKDWLRINGKDMELDNGSIVSYFDYANTYPIFAFDISNDHSLFENVQNNYIELIVQFAQAPQDPAATPVPYWSNAVICWERELKLSSAGDSITLIRP